MKKIITNNLPTIIIVIIVAVAAYYLGINWSDNYASDNNSDEVSADNISSDETIRDSNNLIPKVGDQAPNFKLKEPNGTEYSLNNYKDKKNVLVIFETTWCSWCAKERADIEVLHEEAKDSIAVITIDMGEDAATVQANTDKYDIKRPWILDKDSSVAESYGVSGTPGHFLIDKNGKIIWSRPGYATRAQLFAVKDIVEQS